MIMPNFAYVRPRSLKDAVRQFSSKGALIHAGGTDLLGCLRDYVFEARKLVSIGSIKELRGIREWKDGSLRIGALTTITEVANSRVIKERYPALARAASEVGSPQLRNQGTVGGNLCQKPRCWYYRGEFHCFRKGGNKCYAQDGENQYHCLFGSGRTCYIVHPSDTAPAFSAYGASVRVAGPKGTRLIPLEKLYVLPQENVEKETALTSGEILTEVLLPPVDAGLRSSYRKVRARQSWDFALAGMTLVLQFKGERVEKARVVLSGAAPIPWRSKEVEEAIIGKPLDRDTIARASNEVVKKAEPLQHNDYKVSLFRGIVEEELRAMTKA
jgi:xanthine dehydrogenase YagS FAD-binding subunit